MPNPHLLSQALPLEKLYHIHQNIKIYYNKWDKDHITELVDLSIIENFYSGVQQFLRIGSLTGACFYLNDYSQGAGITTVICLFVDFATSSYKEYRFRPTGRKQEADVLLRDTENLTNNYQELVEILKSIHTDNSGNLGELIKSLKEKLSKLIEEDNNELTILKNSPKDSYLPRLFISQRHTGSWEAWKERWEQRRIEQVEIKNLVEILQEAVSKFRQGIAKEKIDEEIKNRMAIMENTNELEEVIVEQTEETNNKVKQREIATTFYGTNHQNQRTDDEYKNAIEVLTENTSLLKK